MELRAVGSHEVDLIENLFQEVYNREKGMNYWRWCFKNPLGYINNGIFVYNRLVGYYAAQLTENSAVMFSAMVHPRYRRRGLYMEMALDLEERIKILRDYVFLFSNEMIRPIHLGTEDYAEVYQIKEYRLPFKKENMMTPMITFPPFFTKYGLWRYRNHPTINYIFHYDGEFGNQAFYSLYENRVQIIDYEGNIERAIDVGNYIAHAHKKDYISFWSEIEYDYPSILIPTWKHYKTLNPLNIDMEDIMKNDKLRMGMSDVF